MVEKSKRRRNTRMRFELSLPLLGLLLCVVGTAAQEVTDEELKEFQVDISGTTVTVVCPLPEEITWSPKGLEAQGNTYVKENHDSSPLNLSCTSGDKTIQMYLKARVCTNCRELDTLTVTGIIIADLLITLGVLILVYYFSKDRKGRPSAGAGSRPRGQKMQRPPPVPNPDYEPIRKGQREVYAGLESRGF
ncbi:T-cell surface glycoprotein CD3 epsilon chain [Anser cygnoides]|uniref:T-cell surface glycoprotein CD3 epsilon chain n=2 Tax=Anser TaxID=8842 RepID=A0A8B9C8N2_9AVES|nr:T-cell surface glycoprotein CD3 epsilon chain [Anser cygnoides]XP_047919353.1 T-cell surface glycoprotein CD3 epsilon chain [Anser cygnoides]XP_047919354.1 T-cell surface glycoprotein CD3 epsilon chain [Anser cygnoides]